MVVGEKKERLERMRGWRAEVRGEGEEGEAGDKKEQTLLRGGGGGGGGGGV